MANPAFIVEFDTNGDVVRVVTGGNVVGGTDVTGKSLKQYPLDQVNTVSVPLHYIRTAAQCYVHTPDCRWFVVPC